MPPTPRTTALLLWAIAAAALALAAATVLRAGRTAEPTVPAPLASVVSPAAMGGATAELERVDVEALAGSPVFGPPPEAAAVPGSDRAEFPAVLVGTMLMGERSRAVFSTDSGQRLCAVGDTVHGARVVGVERDAVVLDVGGRMLRLRARAADRRPGRAGAASARAAPAEGPGAGAGAPAGAGPESEIEYEEDDTDVDLADFDAFADAFRGDFARARTSTAHGDDGRPTGLRLDALTEGGKLEALGFATGDVVTHVNDASVASPAQLLAGFARAADEVRAEEELFIVFDLVRGGGRPDAVIISIW